MDYKNKYIKYKNKYIILKKQYGRGPDINEYDSQNSETPLYSACDDNNIEKVRYLLTIENIDVNKGNGNITPLYIACNNNFEGIVKLLLEHPSINVNMPRIEEGDTPLYIACENNRIKIVELLLSHQGIDVNKDFDNKTPLYIACDQGHIEIVQLLLARPEIDVNKYFNNTTPLHIACEKGHIEIVKLLLAHYKLVELLLSYITTGDTPNNLSHMTYKIYSNKSIDDLINNYYDYVNEICPIDSNITDITDITDILNHSSYIVQSLLDSQVIKVDPEKSQEYNLEIKSLLNNHLEEIKSLLNNHLEEMVEDEETTPIIINCEKNSISTNKPKLYREIPLHVIIPEDEEGNRILNLILTPQIILGVLFDYFNY